MSYQFFRDIPHMFNAGITAFNSFGATLLASLCIHYLRQMMKDKTVIDQKTSFINNFTKNSKLQPIALKICMDDFFSHTQLQNFQQHCMMKI